MVNGMATRAVYQEQTARALMASSVPTTYQGLFTIYFRSLASPSRVVHLASPVETAAPKDWANRVSMGVPKIDGLFHGKSHLEINDLGYPHFRKPPNISVGRSEI